MGLRLHNWTRDDAVVVVPEGRLDLTTYKQLRDHLVKLGTDAPRAVIVDLAGLSVESQASLALFTTVHTRLAEWPGVPLLLVAGGQPAKALLARSRTARYVPVHHSVPIAVAAIGAPPPRRVARTWLPNSTTSPRLAREFARHTCVEWHVARVTDDVVLLVSELVANAVVHTASPSRVRLELRSGVFSVAVYDDAPGDVCLLDPGSAGAVIHGLLLVAQIAATWGRSPTADGGKVVWATLHVP